MSIPPAYAQYEDPNSSFDGIADHIFGDDESSKGKVKDLDKSKSLKGPEEFDGSKYGLDQIEKIRIKRPLPNEVRDVSAGEKPPQSLPRVAPNIVRHSTPKIAPSHIPNQYQPSSDTRIARPVAAPDLNSSFKAEEPESNTASDMVSSGTLNIDKLNTAAGAVASPKQKTPALLNPGAEKITSDKSQPKPAGEAPQKEKTAGDIAGGAAAVKNTIPGLLPPQKPKLATPEDSQPAKSENTAAASGSDNAPVDINGLTQEKYPAVARLETLTFGVPNPSLTIADRLAKLETSIFARVFEEDSLFDRTERLKRTLLGVQAYDSVNNGGDYGVTGIEPPITDNLAVEGDFVYLDELAKNPGNQEAESKEILSNFALELVNFERKKRNLPPLESDELIQKMADEHIVDMLERKALSHSDLEGRNPDRRYTEIGGVHAVTEGLVATSTADLRSSKLTKAVVCVLLKKMLLRQDDREALLSPWATHLASSFGRLSSGTRIFAVTEVMTKRAQIQPLKKVAELGDKVKVSGTVHKPYKFERITLAWEEFYDSPIEEDPAADEALPYFPPLDYIAYSTKSEKDYSKAITALKALGVMAAIAGGVFVPPVALAAPLIVMAGPGGGEIRPKSDIPVKGGVKLNGSSFKAHIELDNESQEGLYYVTVWASLGDGTTPVAVSRRAIMVKKDLDESKIDSVQKESSQEKSEPIEYTKESDGENKKAVDRESEDSDEPADDSTGI